LLMKSAVHAMLMMAFLLSQAFNAVSAAALVGTSSGPTLRGAPVCATRQLEPQMVAAKEVYKEFLLSAPPVQKSMKSLTPMAASGVKNGVVAAAGIAGYLLTPSSKVAVNAVGGVLSGGLGVLARKRFSEERREAAVAAVASLLSNGLQTVTPAELAAVADRHGVPAQRFQKQLAALFLIYFNRCLESSKVETSELSELFQLKSLLRLSPAQVGMQTYAAARQLYSRHRAYLEADEDSDSKLLLTKFAFLAERLISTDESEEGYRYEATRLQRLFSLTEPAWRQQVESAALPFYATALESAVFQGKASSAKQLAAVRDSLGLSVGCADGMHEQIFTRFVAQLLKCEPDGKLSEADAVKLTEVEFLLTISEDIARKQLLALTTPLYKVAVVETLSMVSASEPDSRLCAQQAGTLALRQQELLLDQAAAKDVELETAKEIALGQLEEAVRFQRAQNVPMTVEAVQKLMASCDNMLVFMRTLSRVEGEGAEAVAKVYGKLANLKDSEVLSLYRLVLLKCLDDLEVDAEEEAMLSSLRQVLGLSDEQCTSIYEAAAGPLFLKNVEQAASGELGDEQKSTLQRSLAKLGLPPKVALTISTDVYASKLREVAADNKIINEEQAAKLAALRDFLSLDMEQVYSKHEEICSGAYRNSVREVMGVTGIIPDEYWDGLGRLRERLGLSEESARSIFASMAREKMRGFGQKAVDALQEKMGGGASKDTGDDPLISGGGGSMAGLGIEAAGGSLTTEILNLVDFCLSAKVLAQRKVEVDINGTMVEKEVEVIGTSLQGEFSNKVLRELYKQYLIEAFSGQQAAQNQRLFNNLNRLALVLGLEKDEVAAIHNELGTVIYRRYLSRALQQTGSIGERERSFLSSIRSALDMDSNICDKLVRESQVNHVSDLVQNIFERSEMTADKVRKMRDAADNFEVSLIDDLDVTSVKLEKMFTVELDDLVETGELAPDDTTALEELCESLHVSEARAGELLQETVAKRCRGGVLQAAALARQSAHESMLDELNRVLKFAVFAPVEVSLSAVSQSDRQEMLMLYQANALTKGALDDEKSADLELLKTIIGLSAETAASPA